MRGRTLAQILESVRLESGRSSSTTLGLNEAPALKQKINRAYEFFWFDYNWPFLKIMDADKAISAGTYKFDPPTSIDLERIEKVSCRYSDLWYPMEKGIATELYNALDSENDERSEPAERYDLQQTGVNIPESLAQGSFAITGGTSSPGVNRVTAVSVNGVDVLGAAVNWATSHTATAAAVAAQINTYLSSPNYIASSSGATVSLVAVPGSGGTPNGFEIEISVGGNVTAGSIVNFSGGVSALSSSAAQIIIWPRPSVDTTIRFQGRRAFTRLVNDSDVCLLDDQVIYLHVAAELLGKVEDPAAPQVAAAAKRRYNVLKFGYDKGRLGKFNIKGQPSDEQSKRGQGEVRVAIAPVST